MWQELSQQLQQADTRALARCISLVENEREGYLQFLQELPAGHALITGITGPPGAGKSTLVDALIAELLGEGKRIAVLCIDPSSPFHLGAVLGDRIRMSQWYNHPGVYIRSFASRGNLGGLNRMIIEITELVKSAGFDHIIIETVGIGQSEVEIAGLADCTVVVLVPEGGDEIQTMKAGLMEIADIFVVNKSDRPGADQYIANLRLMLAPAYSRDHQVPIIKTVASEGKGIHELAVEISLRQGTTPTQKKIQLLTRRAWHILQRLRMQRFDMKELEQRISKAIDLPDFNLFQLVAKINNEHA